MSAAARRRVLVVYSRVGGGHQSAARALAAELDATGQATTRLIDVYVDTGRFPLTTFPAGGAEEGPPVRVGGRLVAWRGHGKTAFAHVADESGRIQLYFKKDQLGEDLYTLLDLFDIGDVIGVAGPLFRTRTGGSRGGKTGCGFRIQARQGRVFRPWISSPSSR